MHDGRCELHMELHSSLQVRSRLAFVRFEVRSFVPSVLSVVRDDEAACDDEATYVASLSPARSVVVPPFVRPES